MPQIVPLLEDHILASRLTLLGGWDFEIEIASLSFGRCSIDALNHHESAPDLDSFSHLVAGFKYDPFHNAEKPH
jgi:hypothetical protein